MDDKADLYDQSLCCATFNITTSIPYVTFTTIPPQSVCVCLQVMCRALVFRKLQRFFLLCTLIAMRSLVTLLAFFELSCVALHVRQTAEEPNKQERNRLEQDAVSIDNTIAVSSVQIPPKRVPWWKLPNTNNGEMNALTGQQLRPFPDDDGDDNDDDTEQISDYSADNDDNNGSCRIKPCQGSGTLNKPYCGPHARCLQGYCRCDVGWKPAGNSAKARGWTGLEALTVWADGYDAGCTQRCDSLSCAEVPQLEGCFVHRGTTHQNQNQNQNNEGSIKDQADEGDLATDTLHLGAIKAPGIDGGV